MKLVKCLALSLAAIMLVSGMAQAKPNVMPVGTIRYNPEKTWNSFIILSGPRTAKLIDRNGNLVHEWDLKNGQGQPNKVYPGGYLISPIYPGFTNGYQDANTVALMDFNGNLIRKFSRFMQVPADTRGVNPEPDGTSWISRQHHDFQLEGSSTGYYAPEANIKLDGKMLILAHNTVNKPKINSLTQLHDDVIIIVDKDENILWRWDASDHFEEFNLQNYPEAMRILGQEFHPLFPVAHGEHKGYDWFHINCASWLGPNQWYDQGDERFHPENIICDSRETGHMFIIDHKTGRVVWQVAPPFVGEDANLHVIGPHHTHMIPKGLPGAGNIMVFDNGGVSTYFPALNYYFSRVLEFNPVTKEITWEYSHKTIMPGQSWGNFGDQIFFSPFISNTQRLPNGNTLICEGSSARIIEVTPELEIVWEYVSPYNYYSYMGGSVLYRAYAVPYDDVPQLNKPLETAVVPPAFGQIVLPDVNGKLPNTIPVMDQNQGVQPESIMPIMTPAFIKANR